MGVCVLIILFGLAWYSSFRSITRCADLACFQNAVATCKRVSFLKEDPQASWRYVISEKQPKSCIVTVTLLQAKQGGLELNTLNGFSMECGVSRSLFSYPEKDLDTCHGRLKEEIQVLMIKKLHTYILSNVGGLDAALNRNPFSGNSSENIVKDINN